MTTTKRRGMVRLLVCLVLAILLAGGYGYWALVRPLPLLRPVSAVTGLRVPTGDSRLTWPLAGQAAAGIVGSPLIQAHGAQTAAATASTAKLITALTVLSIKPLALNQPGPLITLSAADVALYNSYVAQQGSVVPVQAGEQISEYQVLQAMLLPSANNMADSLADWAYGSLPAYAAAANSFLARQGLTATHVGSDASGFAPSTTSTAHDLVMLGELAMQNPVLAQIAGQATADGIPVAGSIKNVNFLLGTDGIVGLKTGNTDQAGGVYISASQVTVNHRPITVVTALVGAPTLYDALQDSLPLIQSAQANFQSVAAVSAGAIVGRYRLPWGSTLSAIAGRGLTTTVPRGAALTASVRLRSIPATARAGQAIGQVTLPQTIVAGPADLSLILQTAPSKPPVWWRLTHP